MAKDSAIKAAKSYSLLV